MKRACLLPALLCLFFSVVSAYAQVEKITSVEGITEYRLQSNGLRILLFPDLSKPTITVNVIYLVEEQKDRKSTRLNSSHGYISYAVFCLKKKTKTYNDIALDAM